MDPIDADNFVLNSLGTVNRKHKLTKPIAGKIGVDNAVPIKERNFEKGHVCIAS